ncbi:MAG: hypothetical protein H7175_24545, partial [Burkholderiales bacterium]|nr:hypothetical protein [Anaerolineae bacterium]
WGVARGGLLKGMSSQEVANSILDRGSPLAKTYTQDEARAMFGQFRDVNIKVVGEAGFDAVPTARFPFVSKAVLRGDFRKAMVKRYGFFLWISGKK